MLKNIIVGSLAAVLMAAPNTEVLAQQSPGQVEFVASQGADQWLTSDVIGQEVTDPSGETVGDVNALIVGSDNEIAAVVFGVGGFLGIGEKDVAVSFDAINQNKDEDGNTVLVANVTKEQLESAPSFEPRGSSDTMQQVKEEASEAGKQAKEMAGEAAEEAKEIADEAVEEAKDMAETASEKASEMTDGESDQQQ